ncbi:MAG: DUF5522 domain-containing protein [Bdellovibrionota bacterium]
MTKKPDNIGKVKLIQGIDYYFNEKGLMVFTKEYHLKRGYCCQSGCLNCPYGFKKDEQKNKKG